jgi:hypothetical protein
MALIGADTEQLRSTATRIDTGAASLEESARMLTGLIGGGTNWRGPDAERFRQQWTGVSAPSIARAAEALRRGSDELRRNAQEQEQASGISVASAGPSAVAAGSAAPATSAAPSSAAAAPTVDGANAAETNAFVQKWQGKMIDPDRSYGAQCFDVFRQYSNEVVGARPNIATDSDYALDIYNRYDRNGVADFYDRIPHGSGTPQPGDIVVYGANSYNAGYGHVALITAVDGDKYSVLEQNYGWQDGIAGNDPAAVRPHTFSNKADGPILGYLRPK